jgi:hypothetical protein
LVFTKLDFYSAIVGDGFCLGKQGLKKRLFFLLYEQIWKRSVGLPEKRKRPANISCRMI